MSNYLLASCLFIVFGVVGILYPGLGGRTWGSIEEVRTEPVKVAKRTERRNKALSVIILLFGVLLLILSIV